jgi:hypothetical protein
VADQDEGGARFGARIGGGWARLAAGYVPQDESRSRKHLVLLEEENRCGVGQEQRLVSRHDKDKRSGLATAFRARRLCSSTHIRARSARARTHTHKHTHTHTHTHTHWVCTFAHTPKHTMTTGPLNMDQSNCTEKVMNAHQHEYGSKDLSSPSRTQIPRRQLDLRRLGYTTHLGLSSARHIPIQHCSFLIA